MTPQLKAVQSSLEPEIRPNYVNIIGGLGNQLFQYLFGESLERRSGLPTVYDISGFKSYRLHTGFVIQRAFCLDMRLLTSQEQSQHLVMRFPVLQKVVRRYDLAAGLLGCEADRTYSLDDARHRSRHFVGYWQSQPYTEEEMRSVTERLVFRPELQAASATTLKTVGPLSRVCGVHVRRGDYVNAPSYAPHYALPVTYYQEAMALAMREGGVKKFVVTSDDPAWVEANLAPHFPIVKLEPPFGSPIGDLCVLSMLSNKVLSNSTFGWWGARLTASQGQIIAPRQWCKQVRAEAWLTPPPSPGWTLLDIPAL